MKAHEDANAAIGSNSSSLTLRCTVYAGLRPIPDVAPVTTAPTWSRPVHLTARDEPEHYFPAGSWRSPRGALARRVEVQDRKSVIERHEHLRAAPTLKDPHATLEVREISRGGEILLFRILGSPPEPESPNDTA